MEAFGDGMVKWDKAGADITMEGGISTISITIIIIIMVVVGMPRCILSLSTYQ